MAEGDDKTLTFRTGAEFVQRFRDVDARIDAEFSREKAFIQAKDPDGAAQASAKHSRLIQELQDLILDELERHWGAFVIDADTTVPEFPDGWRMQFYGRVLSVRYKERSAFKE